MLRIGRRGDTSPLGGLAYANGALAYANVFRLNEMRRFSGRRAHGAVSARELVDCGMSSSFVRFLKP